MSDAAENRRFRTAVQQGQLEEQEEVMEIVTRWMEEGLAKGRQEGMESLVARQLERRFGPLLPTTRERIDNLSEQQLSDLAVALLDFADRATWDVYRSRLSA